VIEARAVGEREMLFDPQLTREGKQMEALLVRFRSRRRARSPQQDDPGVGDALRAEFLEMRDSLRRANTKILGDQ
jgi:hypothetical protein